MTSPASPPPSPRPTATDSLTRIGRSAAPLGNTPPHDGRSQRRRWRRARWLLAAAGLVALGVVGNSAVAWMRAPTGSDLRSGEQLFTHKWEQNDPLSAQGDGLGPVFNARSCAECHFQGGVGGGGDLKHNVAAFEVLPTIGQPQPMGAVIHAFATRDAWLETRQTVRSEFPIVPKGATVTAVCRAPLQKDYDPVVHHSINTPTLFGAGVIDQIPAWAIRSQHLQRSMQTVQRDLRMDFKRAATGRLRILPDGRIGKFGWKAQFATLEEFVANACAVEIGLTTPSRKQHAPQRHREDAGARLDLDERQFAQLTAFVAHLPAPRGATIHDEALRREADRGQELFASIGCADCHTPNLGGAQGVYSDFCLHDLTDRISDGYTVTPEVPVPEDYPQGAEWKTPPLWGVAQTAPYLHDGSAKTLHDAIEAHGGQARHIREKYRGLDSRDQQALLQFLGTLTVD